MSGVMTAARWARLAAAHDRLLSDICTVTPAVPPGQTATPRTVACAVLAQPVSSGDGGAGSTLRRPTDKTIALPHGDPAKAGDSIAWGGGFVLRVSAVDGAEGETDTTGVLAHGLIVGSP